VQILLFNTSINSANKLQITELQLNCGFTGHR